MTWCHTCGAQYSGSSHNCGWRTITADRLRELEATEKALAVVRATVARALRKDPG